jgi:pyridinium-3,5-bisthiocarboxylic acid mononucleotide nickel chelatase
MKIAYLDCFSGMSGDMFLGALVDAGVSPELFNKTVNALNIGAQLQLSRVNRSGIVATKIDVFINGEKELPREEWAAAEDHKHHHEHPHPEGHTHQHAASDSGPQKQSSSSHEHDHAPAHEHHHYHGDAHPHGRSLTQIKALIAQAPISERAKKTATAIFQALGEAEAKVHNVHTESVHFHEVGAVDAIVDIVCAAVGADAIAVDEIVCSPLNVGGGTVKCAHGVFPVPAPATVELLSGVPVYSSDVQKELVTPTGAAIVKVLATRFGAFPLMTIEKAGYGAGTRDLAGHPNVVRLVIGEALAPQGLKPASSGDFGGTAEAVPFPGSMDTVVAQHTQAEAITVLEANLDDLNPQVFGYVMDRLLEEGALDAFGIPVQMKKNRPGMLLTVFCKTQDADRLTHLIFTETTTLGVRRREEQRRVLSRRWVSVATPWGEVRMKIASMNGTVTNYAPEYEDCRKIAVEKHIALKTVMHEAVQKYLLGSREKH